MTQQKLLPFQQSWWVSQGQFLAGCTFDSHIKDITTDRILALIELKCTRIIDLSGSCETQYYVQLKQLSEQMGHQIEYQNIPTPKKCVPAPDRVRDVLDMIDQEIINGGLVYLHCQMSRGCTGLISACYLIRHGKTPEQALEYVNQAQAHVPPQYNVMPRTYSQFSLVHDWPHYDPPVLPSPFNT